MDIVYADPPWQYYNSSSDMPGTTPYETMSEKELMDLGDRLPVKKNAILFLWATGPKLPEAIRVMTAWGFRYKTIAFTWIKTKQNGELSKGGQGWWTRPRTELVLMGEKGKFNRKRHCVSAKDRPSQVILEAPTTHSRKPITVFKEIDRMFKPSSDLQKLELFARWPHTEKLGKGWHFWGNEALDPDGSQVFDTSGNILGNSYPTTRTDRVGESNLGGCLPDAVQGSDQG